MMATLTQIRPGTWTRTPDLRGIASELATKVMRFAHAVNGTSPEADPATLNAEEQTTRAMEHRTQSVGEALDESQVPVV